MKPKKSATIRLAPFHHPEPPRARPRVRPVFLPYQGCPRRCLFCAQHLQTGTPETGLEARLSVLAADLETSLQNHDTPFELGFFGGTFTAFPGQWTEAFLGLAQRYKNLGLITAIRCSTRPDAVTQELLARLKDLGLDIVELGIQTFDDEALAISRRGYTATEARQACRAVATSGLGLGIQLLPGIPGSSPSAFASDVAEAVGLGASEARLYPCLVIRGTHLAAMYADGLYLPWGLARTVHELGQALLALWHARVTVLRIGLAPEPSLAENILAGPVHPALGQLARSQALLAVVRSKAAALGQPPRTLHVPRRHAPDLWGHRRSNAPRLARLGLTPETVRPWDEDFFLLR